MYDYLRLCNSYGCNIADSSTYGYWTSSPVAGETDRVWYIDYRGSVLTSTCYNANYGVRPVITISKSVIE